MIVLGFGKQEEIARKEILNLLNSCPSNKWEEYNKISKEWNAKNEVFDKMSRETAPERYTNFYIYEESIHFNHINRRHAFSPDGWALLQVTEPFKYED